MFNNTNKDMSDSPVNLTIILSSSRPNSRSNQVAKYIHQVAEQLPEVKTQLVSVGDFDIPYDDEQSLPEFHALVEHTDAFLLVMPEYNHSFPGRLKSLLDTEFDAYKHKPVALAGVSSGDFGGARGIQSMLPVLAAFHLVVTGLNLYFPKVKDTFDEQGNPIDEKLTARIKKVLTELVYLAKVIKLGKQVLA
jgi:NAD(P)H-dependent FMN reductase